VWRAAQDNERLTGVVHKHISEGSGFITPDSGGDDIYFSMGRKNTTPIPPVGTRVSYIETRGYDAKKDRESTRATKVRPD